MFWMFSLDRLILFGMAGRACGAWRTCWSAGPVGIVHRIKKAATSAFMRWTMALNSSYDSNL